jgi:hypothetical protein
MVKVLCAFLATLIMNAAFAQVAYTFNGNGNWSDTANWLNRSVPPTFLPKSHQVIIDPAGNGECILNVLFIADSAQIVVKANKQLIIQGGVRGHVNQLKDDVHIIDTTRLQLVSDSAMLSQGVYEFTSADTIPPILPNDFIVGSTGNGFICKVTNANYFRTSARQGSIFRVILNTIKGKLTDIINNTVFSIDIPIDNSLQNGVNLAPPPFQDGALTVTLSNATVTLNPKLRAEFNIYDGSLNYFSIGCNDATITGSFRLHFTATQPVSFDEKKIVKSFRTPFSFTLRIPTPEGVLKLPIKGAVYLNLVFKYSGSTDDAINRDMNFTATNTFNLGMKYQDAQWTSVQNNSYSSNMVVNEITGIANSDIITSVGSEINVLFENVLGPSISNDLVAQISSRVAASSSDWDLTVDGWLRSANGVNATVLGVNVANLAIQERNIGKIRLYQTPETVQKISGDNQQGLSNAYLPLAVKVRVLDERNNPQAEVPVQFIIIAGGGSVQQLTVFTDANGYAQTNWKLGAGYGVVQKLHAVVKRANGTFIQGAPIEFSATTPTFVGTWQFQFYADDLNGNNVLDANEKVNVSGYITFNADGTGAFAEDSDPLEAFTWTINQNQLYLDFGNGDVEDYIILQLDATTLLIFYDDPPDSEWIGFTR